MNGFHLVWIEVIVSDAIAEQRLRDRERREDVVSDARLENLTELTAAYEPPEEIAELAVYLASDESAFTTGSIHIADGGFSL